MRFSNTKKYFLAVFSAAFFCFFIAPGFARAAGEFIITVKTDNPGVTSDHSFSIPTEGGRTYNYNVDWGDGATTSGATGDASHTYVVPGNHQIKITGTFPAIKFNFGGDKDKILSVDQWGNNVWQGMSGAFAGCSHLTFAATDAPDLSMITDLTYSLRSTGLTTENLNSWNVSHVQYFLGTFQDTAFNGSIGGWNMTGATNLAAMFYGDHVFNQDISSWDLSGVTSISSMFAYDAAFNNGGQPLSWGTGTRNVTDMSTMFYQDSSFNQDVSGWDVSKVTNMNSMFESATAFNNSDTTNIHSHPLNWGSKTSKVTNMQGMLTGDPSFNQDVSGWDVSKVTNMSYLFSGDSSFNQDVSTWNVASVTTMDNMFGGAALSTRHYDMLLSLWSAQTLQSHVTFGVGASTYCDSASHAILTGAPNSWTITDGGHACPAASTASFAAPTPSNNAQFRQVTSIGAALTLDSASDRYAFVDFDRTLLGFWRFEQNVTDDSGHSESGTWSSAPAYALGRFGYAGDFNGTTSFDVTLASPVTSSFTVSAWVYLRSINDGAAVVGDGNGHLIQIGGSDRWQFDNTYSADAIATIGVWTHLVGVYDKDAATETLYVNGVNVSSGGGTRTIVQALNIGKRNDDLYIDGKIDDVILFGRALGADEVADLYDARANAYNHTWTSLALGQHYIAGYEVDDYGTLVSLAERAVRLSSRRSFRTTVSQDPEQTSDLTPETTTPPSTAPTSTPDSGSANPPVPPVQINTQVAPLPAKQFVFSRSMGKGASGADVRELQIFLNTHGFLVAQSGAGSSGKETNFFGELTRRALARFQAAKGITPAVGYFGVITRALVGSGTLE